jgi:hypothetical protein
VCLDEGQSGCNQSRLFYSFNLDDHVPSDHLLRDIDRFLDITDLYVARSIAKTHLYRQSRKDRKKVEMLFAQLKRILSLTRLRLRGMSRAQGEFLLAAIGQNLRRMAKSWCLQRSDKTFAATQEANLDLKAKEMLEERFTAERRTGCRGRSQPGPKTGKSSPSFSTK